MARRLNGLLELERWAKDSYISKGMAVMLRRYRIDGKLFRKLQVTPNLQVPTTATGVLDQEDVYRSIYGANSSLSVEKDSKNVPTTPDEKGVTFPVVIMMPPGSFVPFSDQYHSTNESSFAYTQDDRIVAGDYIIVTHALPATGQTRSKRVWFVEYARAVGVTVQMYYQLVLTPQIDVPDGMEGIIDE